MGKVLIRFYEELNDYLSSGKRKRDFEVPLDGIETVREIIEKLGVPAAQVDLLLVNGQSAALEEVVEEGDRISVYPVFERLNIEGVSRIREKPLRKLSFVVDRDLEALAESLKPLGLDVCFLGDLGREQTIEEVKEEHRILLTRRRHLAGSHGLDRVILLNSISLQEQVNQVIDTLDLGGIRGRRHHMDGKSQNDFRKSERASWIEGVVRDFLYHSPENTLRNEAKDQAFEQVIVGFSRGDDPLYDAYKELVGAFHWTPLEIFTRTFPEPAITAGELTVIAWVVAHNPLTKEDNRRENFYPSERWARARIFGEEVNEKLRRYVVATLRAKGYTAVAPALSPHWEQKASEKYVFASTWSERHAAYASGLGTFGLCDGLITSLGKAVRVGSVIARIQIPPTPRPYKEHQAYCLFRSRGICKKCISRCPVGALSESGHDKKKCRSHVRPVTEEYVKAHYGFDGYGCGLCQTGVPCESRIPLAPEPQ